YKYQIDVDGNVCAWDGLFQKLLTGSPVLKVASEFGYSQWYYDDLKPWFNFVPIEADISDLIDKVKWLGHHDEEAQQIGARGRELALALDYETELARSAEAIAMAIQSPLNEDGTSGGAKRMPRSIAYAWRLLDASETLAGENRIRDALAVVQEAMQIAPNEDRLRDQYNALLATRAYLGSDQNEPVVARTEEVLDLKAIAARPLSPKSEEISVLLDREPLAYTPAVQPRSGRSLLGRLFGRGS
ncbi:MAG: hypothetical protein JOZ17_11475, partial [Acetobacteraceae bacterium]|nr:hypothetical protein [Acetobacteraceae bacterium]